MKPSQNTRILKLLSDGEWHGHHSLYAIGCVAHSRISELRKHDYVIEKRQFTVYGKQVWEYRLVGEVTERPLRDRPNAYCGRADAEGTPGRSVTSSTDRRDSLIP